MLSLVRADAAGGTNGLAVNVYFSSCTQSPSLYSAVSRERVEREGSKKKEYDSVADEWVHQRVTESESDDESVEALTVRTPLQ